MESSVSSQFLSDFTIRPKMVFILRLHSVPGPHWMRNFYSGAKDRQVFCHQVFLLQITPSSILKISLTLALWNWSLALKPFIFISFIYLRHMHYRESKTGSILRMSFNLLHMLTEDSTQTWLPVGPYCGSSLTSLSKPGINSLLKAHEVLNMPQKF